MNYQFIFNFLLNYDDSLSTASYPSSDYILVTTDYPIVTENCPLLPTNSDRTTTVFLTAIHPPLPAATHSNSSAISSDVQLSCSKYQLNTVKGLRTYHGCCWSGNAVAVVPVLVYHVERGEGGLPLQPQPERKQPKTGSRGFPPAWG
jgi:hypothetical protein